MLIFLRSKINSSKPFICALSQTSANNIKFETSTSGACTLVVRFITSALEGVASNMSDINHVFRALLLPRLPLGIMIECFVLSMSSFHGGRKSPFVTGFYCCVWFSLHKGTSFICEKVWFPLHDEVTSSCVFVEVFWFHLELTHQVFGPYTNIHPVILLLNILSSCLIFVACYKNTLSFGHTLKW